MATAASAVSTASPVLAERLRSAGERANLASLALPEPPTEAQAAAIRRSLAVYAVAIALMRPFPLGAPDEWALERAADLLDLAPHERELIGLYRATGQRFSYLDRRAANWLFGHVVSSIVGRPHDDAVVDPAAAWAIDLALRT